MKGSTLAVIVAILVLVTGGIFVAVHKSAPTDPNLSANSGPDSTNPFFSVNGVYTYMTGKRIATATTTPCAIKSPSATSTLVYAALQLNTASSSATTWTIAKSANAFSTTTPIGTNYIVGASAQAFINASTTVGQAGAVNVFAPNTYLVFSEVGGITAGDAAGTGFVPNGTCSAQFVQA